ncbi:MAG: hypothetical protein ACI4ES_12230 [Roseburia sp.]
MKVFEKIIEKLEEENRRLKSLKNDCIALSDSEVNAIENKAYNFAIEIVKQAAAEYNNGWIPVSERLPEFPKDYEDEKTYLVTVRRNDGYIFWDKMIFHDYGWYLPSTCEVIAWKNVEPYQPKGE